jgi:hypothetical protein
VCVRACVRACVLMCACDVPGEAFIEHVEEVEVVVFVDLAAHLAELEVELQLRFEQRELLEFVEEDDSVDVEGLYHHMRVGAGVWQHLATRLGELGLHTQGGQC